MSNGTNVSVLFDVFKVASIVWGVATLFIALAAMMLLDSSKEDPSEHAERVRKLIYWVPGLAFSFLLLLFGATVFLAAIHP